MNNSKEIVKEIERFIYMLRPTKQCEKLDSWIEQFENIYTRGCCLNFAMMLKYVFKDKYKCSIVGRGIVANNKKLNEIKECVKINQFNHYLLKVNIEKSYKLFDVYGLDYDYDFNEINKTVFWFNSYEEFIRIIKNKTFDKNNWIEVYHELSENELKELCKLWSITPI